LAHINTSYVLGNKIARLTSDPSIANQGNPQFFYEVFQYWVAFELVQVFHKYGLNPKFKSNIKEWSKDLHCLVQFLKKEKQPNAEEKRAQEYVEILFDPKKTKHYAPFIRCEYRTRMNFENMSNFSIPLVIITWHRMLQEYFGNISDKTFFHFGNYSEQKTRDKKSILDNLHLVDAIGIETKISEFNMIRPNTDADVAKQVCPSLLQWADYVLKPHDDIDTKDDNKLNIDKGQMGPMMS
jgi:hypothetical protein